MRLSISPAFSPVVATLHGSFISLIGHKAYFALVLHQLLIFNSVANLLLWLIVVNGVCCRTSTDAGHVLATPADAGSRSAASDPAV